MKRFLLSIIYLYLAGMLVAQTAPLEILPYPNEVKVHPGHYPFMSCQLVYVSTQFRAYPFERALFSALNRVLLKN